MMKSVILVLIISFLCSCEYKKSFTPQPVQRNGYIKFRNDPTLSNYQGIPLKYPVYFFPIETFCDSFLTDGDHVMLKTLTDKVEASKYWKVSTNEIRDTIMVDSFEPQLLSDVLTTLHLPILYNYFQRKTIYRLSFIPGIMGEYWSITMYSNGNDSAFVSSKILFRGEDSLLKKIPFIDSNRVVSFKPINIKYEDFEALDSLVTHSDIAKEWYDHDDNTMHDAVGFLFEVHRPQGYYYIFRWDPKNKTLQEIIHKMLLVSGVSEKEQNIYKLIYKF